MKRIFLMLLTAVLISAGSLDARAGHNGGRHSAKNPNNPNWVRDGKNDKKSGKGDPGWVKDRKKGNKSGKGDPGWVKDRKRHDKGGRDHDKWSKKQQKEFKKEYKKAVKKASKKSPGWHDNGNHYGWRKPPKRPHRPNCYENRFPRPPRPSGWRPASYRGPSLGSILGISFGMAISRALDNLVGRGYSVDGYGSDMVYLRDVSWMNHRWPDATMYYGRGGFDGSSFYYSTPRRDMGRYNSVYNYLRRTYGAPYRTYDRHGELQATWFTGQNGFITLDFAPRSSPSGTRFYTTLSLGL